MEDGETILDSRTERLRWLLYAGWISSFLYFALTFAEIAGLVTIDGTDNDPMTLIVLAFAVLLVVLHIGTIIYFGMWIHRACKNIWEKGTHIDYTPGWAVGWFFIPIANLFKPFSAMRQIWNASHGEANLELPHPLLNQWWGLWLASSIASTIAFRLSLYEADESMLTMSLYATLAGCVADFFLFPLAMKLTGSINRAQQSGLNAKEIFG